MMNKQQRMKDKRKKHRATLLERTKYALALECAGLSRHELDDVITKQRHTTAKKGSLGYVVTMLKEAKRYKRKRERE